MVGALLANQSAATPPTLLWSSDCCLFHSNADSNASAWLHRVVRDASKKVLVDLQGQIMEVQHDENAQTYTRSGVGRAEGSAER